MRWAIYAAIGFLSFGAAWAQDSSEIVVPPAPPLTPQAPAAPVPSPPAPPPPPGLVQGAPAVSDDDTTLSPNAPPAVAATQPPPPDVAPVPSNDWTSGTTAVLGVLNKVDGSTSQLSLQIGAQAQAAGDLSVSVQACLFRPAGEMPDAAVFVTVYATQQGGPPVFRGWMLRSAPGATFVGNAAQIFRVIGCS